MAVAGWSSRDMLDRYVRSTAAERAAAEARGLNLGELWTGAGDTCRPYRRCRWRRPRVLNPTIPWSWPAAASSPAPTSRATNIQGGGSAAEPACPPPRLPEGDELVAEISRSPRSRPPKVSRHHTSATWTRSGATGTNCPRTAARWSARRSTARADTRTSAELAPQAVLSSSGYLEFICCLHRNCPILW